MKEFQLCFQLLRCWHHIVFHFDKVGIIPKKTEPNKWNKNSTLVEKRIWTCGQCCHITWRKDIASKKFCKILGTGSLHGVIGSTSCPQKLQVLSKQKRKSFLVSQGFFCQAQLNSLCSVDYFLAFTGCCDTCDIQGAGECWHLFYHLRYVTLLILWLIGQNPTNII